MRTKLTMFIPSAKSWAVHRDENQDPRRRVEPEGEADTEPVDEAVDREPGRAQGSDLMVRAGLLRVVAVMQDQQALDQEEREEADAHQGRGRRCVADCVDRLWQHVATAPPRRDHLCP